jgi:hypothetical protein
MGEDLRYGRRWPRAREAAKTGTRGRCVWCGTKKDIHVHHLYYGLRIGILHIRSPNLEIPGWSVVPMCEKHHYRIGHRPGDYLTHPNRWENRNRWPIVWTLRFRYLFMYSVLHPEKSMFVIVPLVYMISWLVSMYLL